MSEAEDFFEDEFDEDDFDEDIDNEDEDKDSDNSETDSESSEDDIDFDEIEEEKSIRKSARYNALRRPLTDIERATIINTRVLQLKDPEIEISKHSIDKINKNKLSELYDISNFELENKLEIPIQIQRFGVKVNVDDILKYQKTIEEQNKLKLKKIIE